MRQGSVAWGVDNRYTRYETAAEDPEGVVVHPLTITTRTHTLFFKYNYTFASAPSVCVSVLGLPDTDTVTFIHLYCAAVKLWVEAQIKD